MGDHGRIQEKEAPYRPSLAAVRKEIERRERRDAAVKEAKKTVFCILFAAMAVVLLNIYVVRIATVNGGSMEPTLHNGDVLICSPLNFVPARGDIVVTELSAGDGPLIKRVIAVPGDTVDIDYDTGTVSVNGKKLDEPYIKELTKLKGDVQLPATVPAGRMFLLGDNRNDSIDSRRTVVGMVPICTVVGRVILRIFPFNQMAFFK